MNRLGGIASSPYFFLRILSGGRGHCGPESAGEIKNFCDD